MGKIAVLCEVLCVLFSIWFTIQKYLTRNEEPYVTTELMRIKGRWEFSYSGRSYKAFEGIPYALPPTDERRFEPPQPIVTPLNDVVDATKEPNKCLQHDYETNQVVGEEDCLYLNIYVPPQTKKSLLPVIVWFHEGAFQRGAGTYTKAKYLMDRDVILVTLNYRLGLCGFLSTGDSVVPGNMGLKDQNLALQWLAKNIKHFGGDPQRISLFGASAGGSSVHYHYLSKSSSGLFSSGVSFSGTALSLWAYDPKPMHTTKQLAATLGCDNESTELLVECLKKLSGSVLMTGVKNMVRQVVGPFMYYPPFAPVAENNTSDYFINRSPDEILRSRDINDASWTSGVVSDEGANTILPIVSNSEKLKYFNNNWEEATAHLYLLNRTLPIERHVAVSRDLRRHYDVNGHFHDDDEQTVTGLVKMRTHKSFFTVLEKATRLQAKANKSPVYTYYYSYRAAMSTADLVAGAKFKFGPIHLDDSFFVLENERIDPTTTESDRAMLEVMLDFWYSAAATGKPTLSVDLPKVNPNSTAFEFLEISGPRDYALRSSDDFGNKKFWSALGFDLEV